MSILIKFKLNISNVLLQFSIESISSLVDIEYASSADTAHHKRD